MTRQPLQPYRTPAHRLAMVAAVLVLLIAVMLMVTTDTADTPSPVTDASNQPAVVFQP